MADFRRWMPPIGDVFLEHGGKHGSKKYVQNAKIVVRQDDDPDLSWLERSVEDYLREGETQENAERYATQDRERLESYGDSWWMIGMHAEADVVISGTVQKIESGGLWGIESDSGKDYLADVALQEVSALDAVLADMGLSRRKVEVDLEPVL